MKIKTVLNIFKQCLPYYEQAIKENWDYSELKEYSMYYGLCCFTKFKLKSPIKMYNVFKTHYKHYLINGSFLFRICPESYNYIKDCIKPRRDFLKEEIIRLQHLIDLGYTDM